MIRNRIRAITDADSVAATTRNLVCARQSASAAETVLVATTIPGKRLERGCGSELVHAVDQALQAQRLLAALVANALQQRHDLAKFCPIRSIDARIARQHGAVGMKHRDGGAGPERDGREEFFVIDGVDAPRHHAEEDAVLAPSIDGQ